ncbi:MAG TPA: GNAT family N-acetyltransferase [Acidimicrobiales bacterium]
MTPTDAPPVRPATPADVDELVRLRALMFAEMGEPAAAVAEPGWRAATAAFTRAGLADGTVAGAVVDAPGAPGRLVASGLGVVVRRAPGPGVPSGRFGHVQSVVTEREWRRRGLAGAVVRVLLDWFVAHGVRSVDLHATASGDRVYRALGFAEPEHPELRWRAPLGHLTGGSSTVGP